MNHNLWYPQLSRNSQNIGIIKSLPNLKPNTESPIVGADFIKITVNTCKIYMYPTQYQSYG